MTNASGVCPKSNTVDASYTRMAKIELNVILFKDFDDRIIIRLVPKENTDSCTVFRKSGLEKNRQIGRAPS